MTPSRIRRFLMLWSPSSQSLSTKEKTQAYVVFVGILSFIFSLVLFVRSAPKIDLTSTRAHQESPKSAIGSYGFLSLLAKIGSIDNSTASVDALNLVVDLSGEGLPESGDVLTVLPKWEGVEHVRNKGWMITISIMPIERVEAIIDEKLPTFFIVRVPHVDDWEFGDFRAEPTIPRPQLLKKDPRITPYISCSQGTLLGSWHDVESGRTVWILSDPDLLTNIGVRRGDNLFLAVEMMDRLRAGRPVRHGTKIERKLQFFKVARHLFQLPWLVGTLTLVLLLAVTLWSAAQTVGALPPATPYDQYGKVALVENTTRLLLAGRNGEEVLRMYFSSLTREVVEKCHAPRGLAGPALLTWLDQLGRSRGSQESLKAIHRAVFRQSDRPVHNLVALARRVHLWRNEVLNGS